MHPGYTVLLGLLVGAAAAMSCEAAERARAEVRCAPAGVALTYDCLIRLTHAGTGAPLAGARLTVGADMPSMPMAHAVKPVAATPAGEPGLYRARIKLEMTGEWALHLRLSAPFRDRIVSRQRFDE
ncbi:MAG TPA: FixH family protein [Burkholderiales bacterium]|nr:FixH family protein [Burkholderiales bacterium]